MARSTPSLQRELALLGTAAPQVVALRGARLLATAGSAPGQREWERMYEEKLDALQEAVGALQAAAWRQQQRRAMEFMQVCMRPWDWPATLQQWQSRWPAELQELAAHGLAPARRRAVANVRRLSGDRGDG